MIKLLTIELEAFESMPGAMIRLEKKANKLALKGYSPQGTVLIDKEEDSITLLMIKSQPSMSLK